MAGTAILLVILAIVSTLIWLVRTLLRPPPVAAALEDPGRGAHEAVRSPDRERGPAGLHPDACRCGGSSRPRRSPWNRPTRRSRSPARRVLWAVQAGLVLAAGGIGLLVVSWRTPPEVAQAISVIGVSRPRSGNWLRPVAGSRSCCRSGSGSLSGPRLRVADRPIGGSIVHDARPVTMRVSLTKAAGGLTGHRARAGRVPRVAGTRC